MKFIKYASSSRGNFYILQYGKERLMIECGLNPKALKEKLDYNFDNIIGCLISHSHTDHCKSSYAVAKLGIDLYCTKKTSDNFVIKDKQDKVKNIVPLKPFEIRSFKIIAFETEHDCEGSVGFVIKCGNNKFLFATDTYFVYPRFKDLTEIAIECNYDFESMDQNINKTHRKRILKSHMGLHTLKEFLRANDLSAVKRIHLLHISTQNGNPELYKKEIEKEFNIETLIDVEN